MTTTSVDIPIEQRAPGESAVRGASIAPFVPINEETVFLDADPVTSSGISTMSSPMSCDSWMNYSSNSSDDLSAISDRMHAHQQQQQQDSSEESSIEFDTSVAQSTPKAKRNFNLVSEYTLSPSKESATVTKAFNAPLPSSSSSSSSSANATLNEHNTSVSQSKRLRGKTTAIPSTTVTPAPSASGSFKRKALLHRNSSLSGAICDIRMIDFAHTTFVRKNDQTTGYTNPTTVQHQGPDNGFLRGIESLRRLLTDIATDEDYDTKQTDNLQIKANDSSSDGVS